MLDYLAHKCHCYNAKSNTILIIRFYAAKNYVGTAKRGTSPFQDQLMSRRMRKNIEISILVVGVAAVLL